MTARANDDEVTVVFTDGEIGCAPGAAECRLHHLHDCIRGSTHCVCLPVGVDEQRDGNMLLKAMLLVWNFKARTKDGPVETSEGILDSERHFENKELRNQGKGIDGVGGTDMDKNGNPEETAGEKMRQG